MKAIALISGGLDSILAAKIIQAQAIEVIPLYFITPFCHREKVPAENKDRLLRMVKDNLNAELKSINIDDSFLEMLKNPAYGFGSQMNPCIDCKILMLSKAKEMMQELGAKFMITGEVLGQRPMSQHKQALEIIAKKSSLEGLVLRPLCAKLLAETIPEKEGWVRRENLLAFQGRGRNQQINLAKDLKIREYSQPAGGCLLTDPIFSRRLKDLLRYASLDKEEVELLKIGRHFRLSPRTKLIVGRDEKENAQLLDLVKENDFSFQPQKIKGPLALGRGVFDASLIGVSAQILSRYCDLNGKTDVEIKVIIPQSKKTEMILSQPLSDEEINNFRI